MRRGIDTASLISSQAAFESIPVGTTLHELSVIDEIGLRHRPQEHFHLLLWQTPTTVFADGILDVSDNSSRHTPCAVRETVIRRGIR